MRLFADTNIAAPTVAALRSDGHDVLYSGERQWDPGNLELLTEAERDGRVYMTKDHDIGALVFRDGVRHAGVLLIDDLGAPDEETVLVRSALAAYSDALAMQSFLRCSAAEIRIVTASD